MKKIIFLVLCILVVTSAYGTDTQKLYDKTVTSVVSLKVDNSNGGCIGTGFYALESDIIVTCYHVVEGATNITAKTSKGNIVSIEGIIDYSEEKDIALLKASYKNSSVLELQANMPKPGTPAYVLGSPKGLDFSFSNGIVSQIRRGKETLIQFTAPVSSGNSGGPLLSEDGKVLGIVSCQLTEGQNLNFAVPSASLYMLNKDNAVTKIQKGNYVNNSNSSGLTSDEAYKKGMEHCELGIKYLDARLYDEAEKEFLSVLIYLPDNLFIVDGLARCYSLSKQYNKLKLVAEAGIKISIKNNDMRFIGSLYHYLADAYRQLEEYDKSIELYQLIIDKYLDDKFWLLQAMLEVNIQKEKGLVFCTLALCYNLKKEYKKSISNFEKALKYFTQNDMISKCNYFIGESYCNLGDYKSAQKYAEKALKLNPNYEPAKELLEYCKKQLR